MTRSIVTGGLKLAAFVFAAALFVTALPASASAQARIPERMGGRLVKMKVGELTL